MTVSRSTNAGSRQPHGTPHVFADTYRSGWPRVLAVGTSLAFIAMVIALFALSASAQSSPTSAKSRLTANTVTPNAPATTAATAAVRTAPARTAPTRTNAPHATSTPTVAADTQATILGRDTTKVVTLNREVFRYSPEGRRDPFVSLIKSGDIRPLFTDLRLTTVAYDPSGKNSVAVLRDVTGKEQYRVRVGSPIGRMRVVRIEPKSVTFVIEEFGFSRQETLAMGDSTRTRTP